MLEYEMKELQMEKLIEKLDPQVLKVDSIRKYLEQFSEYEVVSEDIEQDNGKIIVRIGKELMKLVYLDISYAKWCSIYREHSDGTRYEQVDVIIYNGIRDHRYNRVIKYSSHVEDEGYSYISCSGFSYLDEEIVSNWQEKRVVPIEDLSKIQYSKKMNLTELIGMTDDNSSHIIKKESLKNQKMLVLSLKDMCYNKSNDKR